jgi:8-oxo-dGTP diphosphatase
MLMPYSLVQVAAGAIVCGGRVLICQRAPGGLHPSKWEFPGGKAEPSETLEQALRRELREELNIEVTVGPVLWRTELQYPGRERFALTFFLVPYYTGVVTNRVFSSVCWAPVEVLADFDLLEGDREFVAQIENGVVQLDAGFKPSAQ